MSLKPQLEMSEATARAGGAPDIDESSGRYRMRLTCDPAELDRIFRLRFEVFNLELGEGLAQSYASMRDTDAYDPYCHHLLVEDIASRQLVGTYRLLSRANSIGCGFYSDNEFVLSDLPQSVLDRSVELGRACIRYEHRNSRVLFLLWLGLAQYLQATSARYFFGCCSLTSQSFDEAWQVMQYLEEN
ncbi:MAG: GNAT family N-acyltransferase, partial [Pseudomonadota bacterium]